jgi:sporadic carbohydrate cluster 2OG-Fe(II) oxygenase
MLNEFFKNGFSVVNCDDSKALSDLSSYASNTIFTYFNKDNSSAVKLLENLHHSNKNLSQSQINDLKMKCISVFNTERKINNLMYSAFEKSITHLLGKDLLIQKGTNLVIQMPNDPDPSELHRDYPSMSPFEIVLWVPLVDCVATRSMYILNKERSMYMNLKRKSNPDIVWVDFKNEALNYSNNIEIKYGQAIIFSTVLLHGSHVNTTTDSRISFNTRFKSLFSPPGLKDQSEYFEILSFTDVTKIGLDQLKNDLIN